MQFEELEDAFDNAETLFRSAFSLSDPAPELLNLIKAHPTEAAVIDLLVYYTDAVEENPSRANALASALVTLRSSPDAPMLDDGSSSLTEVFSCKLADLHSRGLMFDEDNTTFGPSNTYLINCLLSGLSFKYEFTACSAQYGNIMKGLNARDNSSTSELLVIGASIQLLINGSYIIQTAKSYIKSANEVATKLRFQKSAGTVKVSNGLKLLDVCQLSVQSKTRAHRHLTAYYLARRKWISERK